MFLRIITMDRKISYTKIKIFNSCPLKWFIHYYIGLYKIEYNYSTAIGFLTHFFIENYVKTIMYERKFNYVFKNDDIQYVLDNNGSRFISLKDKRELFKRYSIYDNNIGKYKINVFNIKSDLDFMNKKNNKSLIDFIRKCDYDYNSSFNSDSLVILNTSLKWFTNTKVFINELNKRKYLLYSEYEINTQVCLDDKEDSSFFILNSNIDLLFKDVSSNKIYLIDFKTNKIHGDYDYKQLLLYAYSISNSDNFRDISNYYLGFYNPRFVSEDNIMQNIKGIKIDKTYLNNLINTTFIKFLDGYYKFNIELDKRFNYVDNKDNKNSNNNSLFDISYVINDFIKYLKNSDEYKKLYFSVINNYKKFKQYEIGNDVNNNICLFCQYKDICHKILDKEKDI